MDHATPAYWPTRILLAIGFVATGIALTLGLAPVTGGMFGPPPTVLGLPANIVLTVVGLLPAFVGLGVMVRIFRGPRDEPPAWRYRDR